MNVSELEQLVALVQSANISELTLRHNGARVTIRKTLPASEKAGSQALTVVEKSESEADFTLDMGLENDLPDMDSAVSVSSPLVGTFRHAKMPVGLGASVKAGQVIGIIEAMKLPNEVTASCAGKVVEVFVEDGQFVEYGQELFALQPENGIESSRE